MGEDPLLAAIVARVAAAWGIPARELRTRRRGSRRAVRARQVAIYLAVVGLEHMRLTVAPFFRRHPTVIGHAVRVVEDLRDDPDFDETLAELERWLALRSGAPPSSGDRAAVGSLPSDSQIDRKRRLCARIETVVH